MNCGNGEGRWTITSLCPFLAAAVTHEWRFNVKCNSLCQGKKKTVIISFLSQTRHGGFISELGEPNASFVLMKGIWQTEILFLLGLNSYVKTQQTEGKTRKLAFIQRPRRLLRMRYCRALCGCWRHFSPGGTVFPDLPWMPRVCLLVLSSLA